MDIETLAPFLLLTASFTAGISGLLVHAQIPRDPVQRSPKPSGDSALHRHIANALFFLGGVMLVWAAVAAVGQHGLNLPRKADSILHNVLVVGIAMLAGGASYWRKRRDRARKRSER